MVGIANETCYQTLLRNNALDGSETFCHATKYGISSVMAPILAYWDIRGVSMIQGLVSAKTKDR